MTFETSLQSALSSRGISPKTFCDFTNIAEKTILKEYGAVFLADFFIKSVPKDLEKFAEDIDPKFVIPTPFSFTTGAFIKLMVLGARVKIPSKCIFENEAEVSAFQGSVLIFKDTVGGIVIELQARAMHSLKMAEAEAIKSGEKITPKKDATSARRNYAKTVALWDGNVKNGIAHWKKNANKSGDKLTNEQANKLNALSGSAQIKMVLELEEKGFWFSTYFNKTILRSVAAPGTSQHLTMLALDIKEHGRKKVRDIMAKHGWFQTVYQDHPHFTFMGMSESELSSLGLVKKTDGGQDFWVPDM